MRLIPPPNGNILKNVNHCFKMWSISSFLWYHCFSITIVHYEEEFYILILTCAFGLGSQWRGFSLQFLIHRRIRLYFAGRDSFKCMWFIEKPFCLCGQSRFITSSAQTTMVAIFRRQWQLTMKKTLPSLTSMLDHAPLPQFLTINM